VGGTHATYSTCFEHSTATQDLFQLGKMIFWHELGPIVLRTKHQYSMEKPQEKYSTP
jgi:hypothetical protein